jgi:hypothetical protein
MEQALKSGAARYETCAGLNLRLRRARVRFFSLQNICRYAEGVVPNWAAATLLFRNVPRRQRSQVV